MNFRRKSVEGLNFDFVLLNIIGFACYSVYNCAMKWSGEYEKQNPDKINPVMPNDVSTSSVQLLLISTF